MFSRLLCTHITDFPGVPFFYHRHLTVEILDFDLGTAWDTVPRFQGEGKGRLIASGSDFAEIGHVAGQGVGIARRVTIIAADRILEFPSQHLEGILQVVIGNGLMVSQESLFRAICLFIGQADADIFDGLAVLADGKAQDSLFPVIGLKGIFIMNLGAVFRAW